MYKTINLFAFDLLLCTHDNCLVVLLAQDHVFYFRKIYQLRCAIVKRYPSNFTSGFALVSSRIIRLVRVIFRAGADHFIDYFTLFQFGLHLPQIITRLY